MDWVLDHLQLLVFLAVAIAGVLQRVRSQPGGTPGDSPEEAGSSAEEDGLAGRTRRLQEDIRRKIAERRGDSRPLAPDEPPPRLRPALAPVQRPRMPRAIPLPSAPVMERVPALTLAEDAVLQRQRELAEKIAQLEAVARTGKVESQVETAGRRAPVRTPASPREMILADLRNPAGTRRALLLREILGEPVGLK